MDEADQLVDDQNRGQIRGILNKVNVSTLHEILFDPLILFMRINVNNE